uniref:uncharacterized protein LOC120339407 n=1 Tax=Styela clava TaxID=7725 RepID=UPI00193AC76E|nr:uncharacterized protein LOC120339407 [Styela clava]
MNPAFLPQYPGAHPQMHYFPRPMLPNYVPWPNYSDLFPGYPCFFIPQYPQVSLIPYEQIHPLYMKPQIPYIPAAPHCPPRPVHPPRLPTSLQSNVQRPSRDRQARYNAALRVHDNTAFQTHNPTMVEHYRTRDASSVAGRKLFSGLRRTLNDATVQPSIGNSVIDGGRKRRLRRRRKKILDTDKQLGIVHSEELSSINMSSHLNTQIPTNTNDDDANYETCDDEDDFTAIATDSRALKSRQCTLDDYRESGNGHNDVAQSNADFTAIATNKSYSHVFSVKSATHFHGKKGNSVSRRAVLRRRRGNLDATSHNSEVGVGTSRKQKSPVKPNTDNYWGAVANIESFWDASIRSICSRMESELRLGVVADNLSPHRDKTDCRCKNCLRKRSNQGGSKAIHQKDEQNEDQKSPELWWDKTAGTEYEWSLNYVNDVNNNTPSLSPCEQTNKSDEYVVVDLSKDDVTRKCENAEGNNNPGDEKDTSDDFCEISISKDSNVSTKRRLLPVDWDSIQQDGENSKEQKTLDSQTEQPPPNIAELDKAIVDHGPLTSDPHTMPEDLQASISFTLEKLGCKKRITNKDSSPMPKQGNSECGNIEAIKNKAESNGPARETVRTSFKQQQIIGSSLTNRSLSNPCISNLDYVGKQLAKAGSIRRTSSCPDIYCKIKLEADESDTQQNKSLVLEEFKFGDLFRRRACAVSGSVSDQPFIKKSDKRENTSQNYLNNRNFYDASKPRVGASSLSDNEQLRTKDKASEGKYTQKRRDGVGFTQKQACWSTEPVAFITMGADKLSVSKLVNKNLSATKSLIDKGWATTFLQPVVSAKQQHVRPLYFNKNVSTYPRRLDNVKHAGVSRYEQRNTRFVPLPVLLACNTNTISGAKRRARAPHRRRSTSHLHQSLLSKRERHYRSKQLAASFLQNSENDRNWTYPSHEEKRVLCPVNETYFRERLKAHTINQRLVTIQEIADETKENPTAPANTLQDSVPNLENNEEISIAITSEPIQPSESIATEESKPSEQITNGSQDKKKTSFLRRIIKSAKAKPPRQKFASNKQDEKEFGIFKGISKKSFKQDRSRESKVNKKSRLFRRHTKSDAVKSTEEGDVNGNIPARTSSVIERRDHLPQNEREENLLRDPGNQIYPDPSGPKGDKNLRSALYKPTFLCMAAIEAQNSGAKGGRAITEEDENLFGLVSDEVEPLPTSLKRRRNKQHSSAATPGARINSETGDVLEMSEIRSVAAMLSSTKILECESPFSE